MRRNKRIGSVEEETFTEKDTKTASRKRRLGKDERAVSPVIGIILMIAITVVIAAVVAAFAYGLIGGVTTSPRAALVVEDAVVGKDRITLLHHGGETITTAFRDGASGTTHGWDALEVRINGRTFALDNTVGTSISLNGSTPITSGSTPEQWETKWKTTKFAPGDELELVLKNTLKSGDTIAVVYTPSGDILQRVKVP